MNTIELDVFDIKNPGVYIDSEHISPDVVTVWGKQSLVQTAVLAQWLTNQLTPYSAGSITTSVGQTNVAGESSFFVDVHMTPMKGYLEAVIPHLEDAQIEHYGQTEDCEEFRVVNGTINDGLIPVQIFIPGEDQ